MSKTCKVLKWWSKCAQVNFAYSALQHFHDTFRSWSNVPDGNINLICESYYWEVKTPAKPNQRVSIQQSSPLCTTGWPSRLTPRKIVALKYEASSTFAFLPGHFEASREKWRGLERGSEGVINWIHSEWSQRETSPWFIHQGKGVY